MDVCPRCGYRAGACENCGGPINRFRRVGSKFCSNACKMQSYRLRKARSRNAIVTENGGITN